MNQLPMADTGGGCACCSTATTTNRTTEAKESPVSTQTFSVTGMTCGHCVSAVSSELKEIPGVTDVTVDLVAGGTSAVTVASDSPVSESDVAAALDEAGDYQLA
ncbi:heavy-metal-associated domain-containing protein [Knoellia sp. GCM10027112]